MRRVLLAIVLATCALAVPTTGTAQNRGLRVVWVDVEGGAATLFVAPNGESLLFDLGFPGNGDRDASRILAAAKQLGLARIDHVVVSHWHGDHVGGLDALAKMIPLGAFYDHGDGVEPSDRALYDGYRAIAGAKRRILKPGDALALGDVQVRVLVSEGPVIASPINGGGPNPLCTNAARQAPAAPENIRMVGLALTYGRFKMATLGDADWSREMELACPVNKLGRINLYTINRHGSLDNSGAPALLGAIAPQVIVVNNGPRKGLGQKVENLTFVDPPGAAAAPYERHSFLRLAKLPGIEGIWQGHLSLLDPDPAHNTMPDMIANLVEGPADQGHPIMATVEANGTFTVTNARNGVAKRYTAK